ncbi:hypothetical protein N1851_023895 [Merluccius polli]|uniref:Uncharacterized protein n=1 Tax=Merluccius polli TaxID=89951 RepID=A0AA47MFX0_MERPO|nr:hypothetical protein N1851_023895 [Merluccius polli]
MAPEQQIIDVQIAAATVPEIIRLSPVALSPKKETEAPEQSALAAASVVEPTSGPPEVSPAVLQPTPEGAPLEILGPITAGPSGNGDLQKGGLEDGRPAVLEDAPPPPTKTKNLSAGSVQGPDPGTRSNRPDPADQIQRTRSSGPTALLQPTLRETNPQESQTPN